MFPCKEDYGSKTVERREDAGCRIQKTLIRVRALPLPRYVTLGESHKPAELCLPVYKIGIIIPTLQACREAAVRCCMRKYFRSNKNIL